MREPAPPYVGEGPHALWHISQNPRIERFEPHVSATAESDEPRVWAIDTRHQPVYWFPRDCPRGTFWAVPGTSSADAELLDGALRMHVIEGAWLNRMRATRVFAYRFPETTFALDPGVGGYWLSREPVVPLELVELGDLVELHEHAEIPLRAVPNLWPIWDRVVGSTLEFSGVRLRNALPAAG